jgi:hypothetical protein
MSRLGYTRYVAQGGRYLTEQGEHPQTIGYALTDSPVGLAACGAVRSARELPKRDGDRRGGTPLRDRRRRRTRCSTGFSDR